METISKFGKFNILKRKKNPSEFTRIDILKSITDSDNDAGYDVHEEKVSLCILFNRN